MDHRSQISALIADNYGVEAVPAKPGPPMRSIPRCRSTPMCLFKLGSSRRDLGG